MAARCPSLYTFLPNWINRSTVVWSKSHFSLSIVPLIVENIFASSIFAVCFFSLLLLHHFCCCGRTMRQQRYPLLINRCKQATRPYQPPGLIKSNFLFTGQLRSAVVSSCFRIIFCLPSLTTRLRNRANCRTAFCHRLVQFYSSHTRIINKANVKKKKRGMIYACRCLSDTKVPKSPRYNFLIINKE